MNDQQRANLLARTVRHLTTDEIDRLLHRYDLSRNARHAILEAIADEENDVLESWSERAAEGRGGCFPVTRWAAYYAARPLYGPEAAPAGWGDDENDCPF